MIIELPIRLKSTANLRQHWAVKARATAAQRGMVKMAVINQGQRFNPPIRIVLTRQGVRTLDDDNLQSAFKGCRDGVADALGIDDGSKLLRWEYQQEKSKTYGIKIEITELNGIVTVPARGI